MPKKVVVAKKDKDKKKPKKMAIAIDLAPPSMMPGGPQGRRRRRAY